MLCYCSTDEYPLDRLRHTSIDCSISPPFSFHGHYGRHRVDRCQRQSLAQTFFVKAHGSRRNFSDITFNSPLLCYCILHSVPNEKGSLRDRRKSQTGSRGQYTLFFIRMLFFQPRLNILVFLPILG